MDPTKAQEAQQQNGKVVDTTQKQETEKTSDHPCSLNRSMLSSKAVYFFEYAKEGCHWQYLILFYCSMGLSEAQAGFSLTIFI